MERESCGCAQGVKLPGSVRPLSYLVSRAACCTQMRGKSPPSDVHWEVRYPRTFPGVAEAEITIIALARQKGESPGG